MRTLLAALVMLYSGCCCAQYEWTEAYISLQNGNALVGQAKLTQQGGMYNFNLSQKLKFRTDKESRVKKFRAREVKEVLFTVYKHDFTDGNVSMSSEDLFFVPVITAIRGKNKSVVLMQELVSGTVSLYGRTNVNVTPAIPISSSFGENPLPVYNGGTVTEYTQFWLGKENEAAVVIKEENLFESLEKQLLRYFIDCPYITDFIKTQGAEIENLEEIVLEYNVECGL